MEKLILILSVLFLWIPGKAHTIQGKIQGLSEGETVYLMTHPDHTIEHKWSLSQKVDSTTVKNGEFQFVVPDAAYGRLWLLRTPKKTLKYYFNKNEDIRFEGRSKIFGLFDEKVSGGQDWILLEDIFSILDGSNITPIDRTSGVEWLTRHISEDIGLFATAYFYLSRKVLRTEDIEKILEKMPAIQQGNPCYKVITDFYQHDRLLQPGKSLPNYTLVTSAGEKISRQSSGHPQIIFYCRARNFGNYYIKKVQEFIDLQQKLPDLELVLVYPEFPEEISELLKTKIDHKSVLIADYEKTAPANEDLFFDHYNYQGIILVNQEGKILAINPDTDNYEEIFTETPQEGGYTINGYVLGMDEGMVELVMSKKGSLTQPEVVDSVMLQKGYFTFRGKLPAPQYCNIGIRGTAFPVGFYLENSSIDVNIKIGEGTNWKDGVATPIKTLDGKIYGSQSQKESDYLSQLQNQEEIEEWISTHPSNIPTLMNLATGWSNNYSPDIVEKWLNLMDKNLTDHLAYQRALQQIAKHRELAIGAEAPDFTLTSDKGKKTSLKKFRGKYVLLDFWASWCGPCRAEIPNLKKAWDKYHSKGLEIISVTLDRKEQEWRKALADEKMPWTQLTGQGTKVSEAYNVQGIPHILLIDRKGKIVGINMRGKKLEDKLAEIFHH